MRGWINKFRFAFSGMFWAFRSQTSCWVHLAVGIAVLTVSIAMNLEAWRIALLVMCVAAVISAELFNTAIESLTQVIHPDRDPRIGRALDVAAAAVLVVSMGAAAVGFVVLGPPIWLWING